MNEEEAERWEFELRVRRLVPLFLFSQNVQTLMLSSMRAALCRVRPAGALERVPRRARPEHSRPPAASVRCARLSFRPSLLSAAFDATLDVQRRRTWPVSSSRRRSTRRSAAARATSRRRSTSRIGSRTCSRPSAQARTRRASSTHALLPQVEPELTFPNPLARRYRLIRRRIAWLLGNWVGEDLAASSRSLIYQLLVHLLSRNASTDPAIRLTAARSLARCDTWDFDQDAFVPLLPRAIEEIVQLLGEVELSDSRMRLNQTLGVVIDRVGQHVRSLSLLLLPLSSSYSQRLTGTTTCRSRRTRRSSPTSLRRCGRTRRRTTSRPRSSSPSPSSPRYVLPPSRRASTSAGR